MKKNLLIYCFFLLFSSQNNIIAQQRNNAHFVNPFIGTGGHGHTYPGATVPFGMVQLSPDTRIDGSWDGCSGYHYSDSIIYGFSHTHLSGTGCSDYGDIALLPFTNYTNNDQNKKDHFDYKNYAAHFSHKNEKAVAGYYSVVMDNHITAELTSTTRVGFQKYTYPENEEARIVVQIDHRDKTLESQMTVVNDRCVEGFRRSEAWAKDQHIYFVIEFSEPFSKDVGIGKGNADGKEMISNYQLDFGQLHAKSLFIKVGISNVSIEGARKNLQAELPHWDFSKVRKDAAAQWDKELSKIEVSDADNNKLSIFYTALYHTMTQPNIAMDVDGKYRGRDNNIHAAVGFTYYSVFSLWDTFRAAHPLYTIIDQRRTADFINTFLAQYEQGSRLPVWELASNETDCMIGYHAVSVIADAVVKGVKGFDYELAFEACKHSAMLDHLGLDAYKKNGFISMDDEHESVSKTLEYAYDDWCIAQIAMKLNKTADYNYFINRSQSWKNVFDTETGFMRPKKNGGWLLPFEPREVNNNYTEGNSWQYTFFVPQDIPGLMMKMGGQQKFENKLDELFSTSNKTTGREQADITGLIGQYAHGNEPSHHMTYLYNFCNQPSKTQYRVHQILNDFYKNEPDGLIGNEDCGQMSAWYVLSALGFYQVTPGTEYFMLGSPAFNVASIHLENGKTFTINADNLAPGNCYISSAMMNTKMLSSSFFSYNDLLAANKLYFVMSDKPLNKLLPPHLAQINKEESIVTVPIIQANSKVFEDSLRIELKSYDANTKIFYKLQPIENKDINVSSIEYTTPFYIYQNTTIVAYSTKEISASKNQFSNSSTAHFYKRPNNWGITINATYNTQYTAGGDKGIIDGVKGETNWRKGEWQGYQSQDFECIIDLQNETEVSKFSASFLQDTRSWILMPLKVEFYTSTDNVHFALAGTVQNDIDAKDYEVRLKDYVAQAPLQKRRFVKVKAYNFGKLPVWHQGSGGDAFIFIDEIGVW